MAGFSEAWLRQYQSQIETWKSKPTATVIGAGAALKTTMARQKPAAEGGVGVPVRSTPISFTLSRPTPLLNITLRQHWSNRRKGQAAMSAEIAVLVPHVLGRRPFERALVTITRYSVREPDEDGFRGGLKSLIDCLLVRSERHPNGLGFIVDDAPDHLTTHATSVLVHTYREQRTEVSVVST